jgi:methyl-accepting chemotaxis protein
VLAGRKLLRYIRRWHAKDNGVFSGTGCVMQDFLKDLERFINQQVISIKQIIKNLKSTLKHMVSAMGSTRHLIQKTDRMNTKLNEITSAVRTLDKTFSAWEEMNKFVNTNLI